MQWFKFQTSFPPGLAGCWRPARSSGPSSGPTPWRCRRRNRKRPPANRKWPPTHRKWPPTNRKWLVTNRKRISTGPSKRRRRRRRRPAWGRKWRHRRRRKWRHHCRKRCLLCRRDSGRPRRDLWPRQSGNNWQIVLNYLIISLKLKQLSLNEQKLVWE